MSQRDYVEKDYYAVLGVGADASADEIRKAYRTLARELHPDARPDDPAAEARFKEVSEAHAVLSNAEKRAEYDQVRQLVGSGAFRGGAPGGFGGFGGPGGAQAGGVPFDVEDLLGGLFGSGGGSRPGRGAAGPRRGRDVSTELTLSLPDAMSGVTTTLRVRGRATCSTCRGTRAAPGTQPVSCPTCGGRGQIARDQGLFSLAEACIDCGGTGQQIPDPCPSCSGQGTEVRTREIRARIPAGVKDGATIRLKGKGEAGPLGGEPGDLLVSVHVTADSVFGRRGDTLTVTVPVTMTEAALGTKVEVPTLADPVTVKIPAGTQSGAVLRVRGRGAPKANGGRGDLLVNVEVAIPRKLTKTQKQMLEGFGATEEPDALRAHLDALLHRGTADADSEG